MTFYHLLDLRAPKFYKINWQTPKHGMALMLLALGLTLASCQTGNRASNPRTAGVTQSVSQSLPSAKSGGKSTINVTPNLAYGQDARQRLDIYTPALST